MTRSYDERCSSCGVKTMIDWLKCGARVSSSSEDESSTYDEYESILCTKCCNEMNFKGKLCYSCSEYEICSSSFNDVFNQFIKKLKGI